MLINILLAPLQNMDFSVFLPRKSVRRQQTTKYNYF